MDLQKRTLEYMEQVRRAGRISIEEMNDPNYHPVLVMMLIMDPRYVVYLYTIPVSLLTYILNARPELVDIVSDLIPLYIELDIELFTELIKHAPTKNLFTYQHKLSKEYSDHLDEFDDYYGDMSTNKQLVLYDANIYEGFVEKLLVVIREIKRRQS